MEVAWVVILSTHVTHAGRYEGFAVAVGVSVFHDVPPAIESAVNPIIKTLKTTVNVTGVYD